MIPAHKATVSVPVGLERVRVRVVVMEAVIAERLAKAAARNRTGRATAMGGALRAKALGRRRIS